MRVQVGCEFVYTAEVATHAVIQVEPKLERGVVALHEQWTNEPLVGMARYVDSFGNVCRRATMPVGPSRLRYQGLLEVPPDADRQQPGASEISPADLPDDVLMFTLPSRFCPSDDLADAAWQLFGASAPGWARVAMICDWVHHEVHFNYESTSPFKTAADVLASRTGVCRDFAHLAVTFCRALNIPARYVFGYLPDIGVEPDPVPMDFCAWIEVFLEGGWWTFDPRNNQPRIGRALLARGRDALDVSMISTYGGPILETMVVWADEVLA
jgi:transglutaminase-like putative cysteine protease